MHGNRSWGKRLKRLDRSAPLQTIGIKPRSLVVIRNLTD